MYAMDATENEFRLQNSMTLSVEPECGFHKKKGMHSTTMDAISLGDSV